MGYGVMGLEGECLGRSGTVWLGLGVLGHEVECYDELGYYGVGCAGEGCVLCSV